MVKVRLFFSDPHNLLLCDHGTYGTRTGGRALALWLCVLDVVRVGLEMCHPVTCLGRVVVFVTGRVALFPGQTGGALVAVVVLKYDMSAFGK